MFKFEKLLKIKFLILKKVYNNFLLFYKNSKNEMYGLRQLVPIYYKMFMQSISSY